MALDLGSARTHTHKTAIGTLIAVLGLSFLLLMFLPVPAKATSPEDEHKVLICHATDSYSNPYVDNEVDIASVKFAGHNGDDGPVFYPEIPKHTKWGDIIPPFDYGDGRSYPGKNWTAEGQLIWSHGCALTPPSSTTSTEEPSSTTTSTEAPKSTTTSTEEPTSTTTSTEEPTSTTTSTEEPTSTTTSTEEPTSTTTSTEEPTSTTTSTEEPTSTTTSTAMGEVSPTSDSIDPTGGSIDPTTTTPSSVAPTSEVSDSDLSPTDPAAVQAATVSRGTLPVTGTPVLLLTVLGIALVLGGVALVFVGRRQDPTHA